MNNEKCIVYDLGNIDFQSAWDIQNNIAADVAEGTHSPALLLLQHTHTYTFGQQGNLKNLLWNENLIKEKGIELHWIDRGGDVTYHGPGQLVGYPILKLMKGEIKIDEETKQVVFPPRNYVGYLRNLESVIIQTLAEFGIVAGQIRKKTGVWVQPSVLSRCRNCPPHLKQAPAKIASIGVRVDAKGISRHGFALNVDPDMSFWEGIIACGLENQSQVSLANLMDSPPSMEEVIEKLLTSFSKVFEMEINLHAQPLISI